LRNHIAEHSRMSAAIERRERRRVRIMLPTFHGPEREAIQNNTPLSELRPAEARKPNKCFACGFLLKSGAAFNPNRTLP
jgi:hypothetical protein